MRTLALLLIANAAAFAQCSADGTIVNAITGAPVDRAHISIATSDDTVFADSDATGKWTAEHVPCGNVTIIANRPGFLKKELTATPPAHDLKLQLAPQSVLAGRVLDEQGDPILGAQVSLMTWRVINGVRVEQASTSVVTNDLGEYRFPDLASGKYAVCANAGNGAFMSSGGRTYGEKCYPASASMDVSAGYAGGADLVLVPLATVKVSGVVSGQRAAASVMLVHRDQILRMYSGLFANVNPDGSFVIRNVPPGSYNATVSSGSMSTPNPVEIGSSDIDSLHLHVEPGATVTGTMRPAMSGIAVQIERDPAMDGVSFLRNAEQNSDGTGFTFSELPAGTYSVNLITTIHFYVKSVTFNGRDILNGHFMVTPAGGNIEVVAADDGGAVEGDVSEPAWVLLQKDGISRNARTDEKGHFKIDNLPPGDYKAYAWDDNTNVEYNNPEWMRQNAKGVDVSVAPSQTAHVTVTRQTGPPT